MPDLLKNEVSLAVLKVQLIDLAADNVVPAANAGVVGASPTGQSPAPATVRRICCELQVTGESADRGWVAPDQLPQKSAPSRRKSRSSAPPPAVEPESECTSRTHTLAQWVFSPEELRLPIHYKAAMQFKDKANSFNGLLAGMAQLAVGAVLNDIRADGLRRLVASTNWLPSGEPLLPAPMARQLKTLLKSVLRPSDCLWIELAEPAGYLPLLPWETMLRPLTDAPILRLSPHEVQANSRDRALCVVACVAAPYEKGMPSAQCLSQMLGEIRRSLPESSTIHVFADDRVRPACKTAVQELGASDSRRVAIEVHEPVAFAGKRKDADGVEPWREWIVRSMADTAVDIVQFITPGVLFPDRPRVVTTWAPTPTCEEQLKASSTKQPVVQDLRYFSPLELSQFLNVLGAWGAVFSTGPPTSLMMQSRMSLRLVVDQIGRLRPGVAVLHDRESDTECIALGETYRFVIGDASIKASGSTSVCVYCHPARALAIAPEPAALPTELMQSYQMLKKLIEATLDRDGQLPAWMATTERVVEQAVSRFADYGPADPSVHGLTRALQFVGQMISSSPSGASPGAAQQGRKSV